MIEASTDDELDIFPTLTSLEDTLNFAQERDLLEIVYRKIKLRAALGDVKPATKKRIIASFKEAVEARTEQPPIPHQTFVDLPLGRLHINDPNVVHYLAVGDITADCQTEANQKVRDYDLGCLRRKIGSDLNMHIDFELDQLEDNRLNQTSRFQIPDPKTGTLTGFLFLRITVTQPMWVSLRSFYLAADPRRRLPDEVDIIVKGPNNKPANITPLYCRFVIGFF